MHATASAQEAAPPSLPDSAATRGRKPDPHARQEAGFTFAELAFAMVVFVIAAVALLNQLTTNYSTTRHQRDVVFAYAKAQAILAEIQAFVDRGQPAVRRVLVARQRALGEGGGVVMEGRDIGTVVFPHAEVKIYLDATAEERARRRANDPAHTGGPAQVADVVTLLSERDRSDQTRAASPLYAAADAVSIDTTGRTIDEVVDAVMTTVHRKLGIRK